MSYYPNVYASQVGPLQLSGLDANFNFAVDIQSQSLYAVAGGSSNIITATLTPAVTALVSGLTLYIRAGSANTTTTPTFAPNGLTAATIVKQNNQALAAGDIAGAGHVLILQYDATNVKWKLANPATIFSSKDAIIHGLTVGLGNNSISTNTTVGNLALSSNTSGSYNTAIGNTALNSNTSGANNTAVGAGAANYNINGSDNTAVGSGAFGSTATGSYNTAVGSDAANSLYSSGSYNCVMGYQALYAFTTSNNNTAIGVQTLQNLITGNNNTAVGYQAANGSSSTGGRNTAVGYQSLYYYSSGSNNCGIGYQALQNVSSGSANTAINPCNTAGTYVPVFDPTTENNRFCMGSTAVTNAYIQVAWTVVSDARDKTDFAPVPHGLAFVSKLQPTAYRYKENRDDTEGHGPLRYGFKAQDVLALEGDIPVIVDAEDTNKLRFNDQALLAVLVNAIKELKAEFDAYKAAHL